MLRSIVRALLLATFVASATDLHAEGLAERVAHCDRELFYQRGKLDEVVSRAQEIVDWAVECGSEEAECRGEIRVVFAELRWGRWRSKWPERQERALEIAATLSKDALALAEVLAFNGYLKATYFEDYEGGVDDLRRAVAIGEANCDLAFLAKAHLLLADTLALRGNTYESFACSLQSASLAEMQRLPEVEHSALRELIEYKRETRFDPSEHQPRYKELCAQLAFPIDTRDTQELTIEELVHLVERAQASLPDDPAQSGAGAEMPGEPTPGLSEEEVRAYRGIAQWSMMLIEHFGVDRHKWDRAEPYLELLETAADRLSDPIAELDASHFRAMLLAERGDFESARDYEDPVFDRLIAANDLNTIAHVGMQLARAYAAGGSSADARRVIDLMTRECADIDEKFPPLAAAKAEQYSGLMKAKLEARNTAETQRRKVLKDRAVNTALIAGLPILAVGLWLWQRSAQSRRMQRELGRQLDLQTESLRLATQRAEEADRAKSDYLARVNHEIRNPLGAIANSCEILKLSNTPDVESARLARSTIEAATDALVDIVDDVLDFTRIESGQLEFHPSTFSLRAMVEAIGQITEPQLRLTVQWRVEVAERAPEMVRTDLPKLRQTILNLCSNAAKHTDVGFVELSVDFEADPADAARGRLVFRLNDTGDGIDPELQPRVFDRFTKVGDAPGAGLGLYISRAFAECLGGAIRCQSDPGVGTTMTVTTPVDVDPRALVGPGAGLVPEASHKRVLVVDDTPTIRATLSALLTSLGYDVRTARTWEEAWPVVELGVDDALLDLRMPQMDGFELARRIRDTPAPSRPRLFAVSADTSEAIRERVRQSGFDGFLSKPFSRDDLIHLLGQPATAP